VVPAKPFRIADFFVIGGLFLAQTINRDWRTWVGRKALHLGYFSAVRSGQSKFSYD
jgi:uncharacterized membrane protein YcfT